MHLSHHARRVTLLVRRGSLAQSMSSYLRHEIEHAPNVEVALHTEVAGGEGNGCLHALDLRDTRTGDVERVDADGLYVLAGGHPRTDWLPRAIERDRWGYLLTGAQAGREKFLETTLPRVFAVGDVRSRSDKRVAGAVGEGSVVIRQVEGCLSGD